MGFFFNFRPQGYCTVQTAYCALLWITHTGVTKGAVAEGSEVLRVEREQLLSWKLQKKSMPSVSSSYPATWCQWWHVCLPWQWSHWQGSPSLPGTGRAAEGGFLQLQWVLILMDDGRWYLSPKTIFTTFLSNTNILMKAYFFGTNELLFFNDCSCFCVTKKFAIGNRGTIVH